MLKTGQYIGMGMKKVELLVRIRGIVDGVVSGHVINGDWELFYTPDTEQMVICSPFGNSIRDGVKVLFTDPVPTHVYTRYNSPVPRGVNYTTYNEVLQYMNDNLDRSFIVSWALRTKHSVVSRTTRFYKRVKTSAQMFMRTWKAGSTDIRFVDMDDDIPF